ncbi:MAG: hypothetical protein Q7J54_03920 [Candidatus Woesearchaeota archaeon]|nr:hypothetical protein [Candidatus Woesearchaeota archaeon]
MERSYMPPIYDGWFLTNSQTNVKAKYLLYGASALTAIAGYVWLYLNK